jgi:hypothetical protein
MTASGETLGTLRLRNNRLVVRPTWHFAQGPRFAAAVAVGTEDKLDAIRSQLLSTDSNQSKQTHTGFTEPSSDLAAKLQNLLRLVSRFPSCFAFTEEGHMRGCPATKAAGRPEGGR